VEILFIFWLHGGYFYMTASNVNVLYGKELFLLLFYVDYGSFYTLFVK